QETQAKLRFDRAWLYTLLLDFLSRIQKTDAETVIYCERILELLTDLESQLPTRRYVNTLIKDLNILPLTKLSPIFNDSHNGLFRDLFTLLCHFVHFPIDDHTGAQYTEAESSEEHSADLARLQRLALKQFKDKLTILALSNYAAIDKREELEAHLGALNDNELESLAIALGFRTKYPPTVEIVMDRHVVMEILLSAFEHRRTYREVVKHLSVLPTEASLYEPTLLRNEQYNGSRSLAIPRLNLQYLSVGDFLWRSFVLFRCEAFFEVRRDMEETVKRLQPRAAQLPNQVHFGGFSRMAIPTSKPAIIEQAPSKVGQDKPAFVRAEIALDVSRLADFVRREWESLHQDDVVYLLAVHPIDRSRDLTNGHVAHPSSRDFGIHLLRTAEVEQILDEDGRTLRGTHEDEINGFGRRPRLRRMMVKLDAATFKTDTARKSQGKPDVYESINVIIRRKGRENNFKRILETIRSLASSDIPVPSWLQEVFLGYGDPTGATYTKMTNSLDEIDFRDTFLDWRHLVESMPQKTVESSTPQEATMKPPTMKPPYILRGLAASSREPSKPSKKRRRDEDEASQPPSKSIKVSTYQPPNNGPYPTD
ncbi:MAG: hypothetical protein Q9183_005412, partial [Haloplaca sp. 2 TL-2023]